MTHIRSLFSWRLVIVAVLTLTVAAPAFGACLSGDSDCDGVLDAFDSCPGTPALDLVYTSGCSVCPCEGPASGGLWPDHTTYVNCVTAEANARVLAHTLTKTQKTLVITHAKSSTCGVANAIRCCTWRKLTTGSMGTCTVMQPASCSFALLGKWAENRGTGSCYYNPCTWYAQ